VESNGFVIYGAGGFAREVAWLAEQCGHRVLAFVDDAATESGRVLNGVPVMTLEDAQREFNGSVVVSAIGDPSAREKTITRAMTAGFRPGELIHPRVERSRWIEIGRGAVVCAGSILTTNIVLGSHVQVNLDCTIGHDVVIGDYATLAPGVHISGWVRLERASYLGTGATIINGLEAQPLVIGEGAVVGAGACVTKSVLPGTTVVGVPARPLSK